MCLVLRWSSVLVVTNQFHQLRSLWTFQRAARDLGLPEGSVRVFVERVPFVGHKGYGLPLLDAAVDLWDWLREVAAIAWYKLRGFI